MMPEPRRDDDPGAIERDPLMLVSHYIADPSARVRGNAASALAVLAGESNDAAEMLASFALGEKDPALHRRILREVAGLGVETRTGVIARLQRAALSSGDYLSRVVAYGVLTHLQGIGVDVSRLNLRLAERAARLGLAVPDSREARAMRTPLVASILIAAFLSAFIVLRYVTARANVLGAQNGPGFVWAEAALLAAGIVLVATRTTTPAYLQLTRWISAAWDALASAAVTGLLSSTVLLITGVTFFPRISTPELLFVAIGTSLGLSLSVFVVRAATLAVADQPLIRGPRDLDWWDDRRMARWVKWTLVGQVAMGLTCGLSMVFLLWRPLRWLIAPAPLTDGARLLEGMFWISVVAMLPLALGFALIDRPSRLREWLALERRERTSANSAVGASDVVPAPNRQPRARPRVLGLQVAAVLLLLIGAVWMRQTPIAAPMWKSFGSREPAHDSRWFVGVPARYEFGIEFLQDFKAEVVETDQRDLKLVLYGWLPAGMQADEPLDCTSTAHRVEVDTADAPDPLEKKLARGCYALEVTDFDSASAASGGSGGLFRNAGALLDALSQSAGPASASGPTQDRELRLTLNTGRFQPGTPFDVTDNSVRTAWWPMTASDWQLSIKVERPMRVWAGLWPPAVDSTSKTTEADEIEISGPAGSIDTDRAQAEVNLEPGRYTLSVRTKSDVPRSVNVAWGSTELSLQPPSYSAALTSGLIADQQKGIWPFDELPARFDFVLRSRQIVTALVPEVPRRNPFLQNPRPTAAVDVILLLERDGKEIAQDDSDPEEMTQLLEPGRYTFRVTGRSRANRPAATRARPVVQPPVSSGIPRMQLELEFTTPPPGSAPPPPSK